MAMYRTMPQVVEAFQLTDENALQVCAWAGGWGLRMGDSKSKTQFWVDVGGNDEVVYLGDWIIKDIQRAISVMFNNSFNREYEILNTESEGGS